ncbi:hypothetical protein BU17DRAFT_57778 [Hysterangium stoloniferum]|nr:hypothetical protein BU17DRAFT_57778 [Hysterangium stoloniferum]
MDTIISIEESLDHLEEVLGPLIGKPLHETTSQLDVLQKAKLQVVIPYVVNDLIFIYLKTRGINPKTHPVIGELDRVKEYFGKIKNAEDPEKRKLVVDQQAATRFLKHALAESQATLERNLSQTQRVHTRFTETTVEGSAPSTAAMTKIQARAMVNDEGCDSNEDSGDLEVFAEVEQESSSLEIEKQNGSVDVETGRKRGRGMDPWTGIVRLFKVDVGLIIFSFF